MLTPLPALALTPALWRDLLEVAHGTAAEPDPCAALDLYGPLARRGDESFVLAQVGQSLDGRVSTPSGDARDISGPDGLRHLHRCRALADAVVIGVGTAIADDPSLTVRLVEGPSPLRVVIDPRGRLPTGARMLHDGGPPVLVVRGASAPAPAGVESIALRCPHGIEPAEILRALAGLGLRNILVEGGGDTIGRFIGAGLVDRLHVAVSPILIGSGPAGFRLPGVERLSDALRPTATTYALGSDVLFDCALRGGGSASRS